MLTIVIDRVAEELANVNNSNEIKAIFRFKLTEGSSISRFEKFYNGLTQVFRARSNRETDSETDSPLVPTTAPLALQKFSHDVASPASTDSRESEPEHHTNSCAKDFLWACHKTLENQLEELAWYPKYYEVQHTSCSARARLIIRDRHKMKILQGNTKIVAESDGGLIIYPRPGHNCYYPVLIIEVTGS